MERLTECIVFCSGFIVPILALWAVACLYTRRSGIQCYASQIIYFATLLMISGLTIRTVMVDDCCWLVHMGSLGVMIVSGVMRRPSESDFLVSL